MSPPESSDRKKLRAFIPTSALQHEGFWDEKQGVAAEKQSPSRRGGREGGFLAGSVLSHYDWGPAERHLASLPHFSLSLSTSSCLHYVVYIVKGDKQML